MAPPRRRRTAPPAARSSAGRTPTGGRALREPRPGAAPAPHGGRRPRRRPSAPSGRSRPCSASAPSARVLALVVVLHGQVRHPHVVHRPARQDDACRPRASASALFLALFGLGAGAVHWAKTLMPDEERVEDRHLHARLGRRPRRRRRHPQAGRGGVGPRPAPADPQLAASARWRSCRCPRWSLLRDTGPLPGDNLSTTVWRAGTRAASPTRRLTPVKPADLRIGSVVHIVPEGTEKDARLPRGEGEGRRAAAAARPGRARREVAARRVRGDRRLLEDLHPHGLPGGPVRAADAPPAVPVPPVDLRRDRRTAR